MRTCWLSIILLLVCATSAQTVKETWDDAYKQSESLEKEGKHQEAFDLFSNAHLNALNELSEYDQEFSHYRMAKLAFNIKSYEKSIDHFNQSAELLIKLEGQEYSQLQYNYLSIINALKELGKKDECVAYYQKVLALNILDREKVLQRNELAVLLFQLGDTTKASEQIELCAKAYYDLSAYSKSKLGYVRILSNLGYIHLVQGKVVDAQRLYMQSIEHWASMGFGQTPEFVADVKAYQDVLDQNEGHDARVELESFLIRQMEARNAKKTPEYLIAHYNRSLSASLASHDSANSYVKQAKNAIYTSAPTKHKWPIYLVDGYQEFLNGNYDSCRTKLYRLAHDMESNGYSDTTVFRSAVYILYQSQRLLGLNEDAAHNIMYYYNLLKASGLTSALDKTSSDLRSYYLEIGKTDDLVYFDQDELERIEDHYGKTTVQYYTKLNNLIESSYYGGYCGDVKPHVIEAKKLLPKLQEEGRQWLFDQYSYLATVSSSCYHYKTALALIELASNHASNSFDKVELHMLKAEVYEEEEKHEKSISELETSIAILELTSPQDSSLLPESYIQLSEQYAAQEDYLEASKWTQKAVDCYTTLSSKHQRTEKYFHLVSNHLYNRSMSDQHDGNMQNGRVNLQLAADLFGKHSSDYGDELRQMISLSYNAGAYDSAAYYLQLAYKTAEAINRSTDDANLGAVLYSSTLLHLEIWKGLIEDKLDEPINWRNNQSEAPNFEKELASEFKANNASNNLSDNQLNWFFKSSNTAYQQLSAGNLSAALNLYLELHSKASKLLDENNAERSTINKVLGKLYMELEDYPKAEAHLYSALKQSAENRTKAIQIRMDIMELYLNMGRDKEVLSELQFIIEDLEDSDLELINRTYVLFAKYYQNQRKYQLAVNMYEKINAASDIDDVLKMRAYHEQGLMYREMGVRNISFSYFKKAKSLYEKYLSNSHPDYSLLMCELANEYAIRSNHDSARLLYNEHIPKLRNSLGSDHPKLNRVLLDLAVINLVHFDDKQLALNQLKEVQQNLVKQLDKGFLISTEHQRDALINTVEDQIDIIFQMSSDLKDDHPEVNEICLNLNLTLKSLLLKNKTEMLRQLEKSKDVDILQLVSEYKNAKTKMVYLQTKPLNDRENVFDLYRKVDSLEQQLVSNYSKNRTSSVSQINWQEIQKKLTPDEVAIEFAQYNFLSRIHMPDSLAYVAYIIGKEDQYPQQVYLGRSQALKELLNSAHTDEIYALRGAGVEENYTYDLNGLANLWSKIDDQLGNPKTVHYAPVGSLNNVPFAAINVNGQALCQEYTLVRYTSLIDLKRKSKSFTTKQIHAVGGVNFGSVTVNDSIQKIRSGTWSELPGTLDEVKGIQSTYGDEIVTVWSGHNATESMFKESISSADVIHLATHGFYEKEEPKGYIEEVQYRSHATSSMNKSGVLFAGANAGWQYGYQPNEQEDGILYSAELAELDLSHVQLVVMSACETGLGKVDGLEGVFGLQRALKLAGAKNIIVSLWQVPDKESSEFMQLFYTQLNEVKNIRTAFVETQRIMQHRYAEEPYKWAAFVLLE